MATGKASDFTIYNEEVQGAFIETIQQHVDVWNAASAGTLRMRTADSLGDYARETFFDVIGSLVSRRDTTSVSAATDLAPTSDEFIGVKRNYKVGPVANTLDSWRKIGKDQGSLSIVVGQQMAKAVPQAMLEAALMALEGKLDSVAALEETDTGATITTEGLVDCLAKQGDAAQNIAAFVMHSKVYYNLLNDQIGDAVYRANGVSIMQGVPATLGRPVVITDSASLVETDGVSSGVDAYSTLALFPGAADITISEPPTVVTDLVTGLENIVYRFQGEGAYNVRLRGCEWDIANGGANPADAALKTATNWDTVVADNKLLPGAILKTR
tara:strand:- start:1500 stop:2480 length:981 start_codon:yes stop_codon:yes gene_type:complete